MKWINSAWKHVMYWGAHRMKEKHERGKQGGLAWNWEKNGKKVRMKIEVKPASLHVYETTYDWTRFCRGGVYSEQPLHILDDNTASTGEDIEEKHENRETAPTKMPIQCQKTYVVTGRLSRKKRVESHKLVFRLQVACSFVIRYPHRTPSTRCHTTLVRSSVSE